MLETLLPVLAPVVLCVALGFAWTRLGSPVDPRQVRTIVTSFGTPCLVFATLVELEVSAGALAVMGVVVLAAIATFAVVGLVILRLWRLPASPYLAPLAFGNLGNMGLPLCLYAFGEAGLELAIVGFAVQSIVFFTLGVWLLSGRASPAAALTMPQPWAVAAAFAFILTESRPPAWLYNTTELIGGLTIPLMLVTLGISLGRLVVVSARRTMALALARLAMGLAVGVALTHLMDLQGTARGVTIILCAMPSAVFNYLMALHYERRPDEVASLVVATTAITLVALPAIVGFAISEAGMPVPSAALERLLALAWTR
ncbi:MAG: AEC family transporter [Alphaproteobacteria bacterium]